MQRQYGGQLLDVPNFRKMYATFKIHRTLSGGSKAAVQPYFSITDASDMAEAQLNGVVWSPILRELGSYGNIPAVASYKQFGNGLVGEGVYGFQDSIVSVFPDTTAYTSFWQVTNLYWNCGTFFFGSDVWEGDFQPVVIQEVINADQPWRAPNNIFGKTEAQAEALYGEWSYKDQYDLSANLKRTTCDEFVRAMTDGTGVVFALEDLQMIEMGTLLHTQQPGGSGPVSDGAEDFVLYNSFVPLSFDVAAPTNMEDWVLDLDLNADYDSYSTDPSEDAVRTPVDVFLNGVWGVWKRSSDETEFGWKEEFVGYFPILDDMEKSANFWNYDSLAALSLPNRQTPTSWVVTDDFVVLNSKIQFSLATFNPNPNNKDILFTVVECDDEEFALLTGAGYTPSLTFVDAKAVTWASYWDEPVADSDGFFHPQDVKRALQSFVFYESPPAIGVTSQTPVEQAKAAWYTPLKRFTFDKHTVTCNMPFFQWGTTPEKMMVQDNGGCDPMILSSLSPSWTGNGPAGCLPTDLPMFRSSGGQVLGANLIKRQGATLLPLDFTIKLHRAVRHDDRVYPYYAVFDSSSADIAGIYGVPQSLRLANVGPAKIKDAVTLVNVFLNGKPCSDCNPWGFQDPIAPAVLDTTLHQFSPLYFDCDLEFSISPINFVSDVGRACPEVLTNAVAKGVIGSEVVYYGDVEVLIDDRRAYQGASVNIINSPFIAQFSAPSI